MWAFIRHQGESNEKYYESCIMGNVGSSIFCGYLLCFDLNLSLTTSVLNQCNTH